MGTLDQAIRDLIKEWKDTKIAGDQRAYALTFTKLEEALMWAEKI